MWSSLCRRRAGSAARLSPHRSCGWSVRSPSAGLKRRLSDVVFRALLDDLAKRAGEAGPGGHSGATLQSSASGPTPAALRRATPDRAAHRPVADRPRCVPGGASCTAGACAGDDTVDTSRACCRVTEVLEAMRVRSASGSVVARQGARQHDGIDNLRIGHLVVENRLPCKGDETTVGQASQVRETRPWARPTCVTQSLALCSSLSRSFSRRSSGRGHLRVRAVQEKP